MDFLSTPFDDDKLREECGIFGVYNHESAAALVALGLHALQHRGQEACGIISSNGQKLFARHELGLVSDTFANENIIDQLHGAHAIGHVRYATTGETARRNIQPLMAEMAFGSFAVAHNGNLTNALTIRQTLVKQGSIFQSSTDTETIIHLMATHQNSSVVDRLIASLNQIEGAYSLICLTDDAMIGVRDPYGVRPLMLGKLDDSFVLASESCALDIIGATYVRDVEPGELVVISQTGLQSFTPFQKKPHRFCVFEYIYFARPDSMVEGRSVYAIRKAIGRELAIEAPVDADMVVPVPDSGVPSAIGFAQQIGLPFDLGIIRNHYVGRTFIEPTDRIRHLGVKLKHNPNRSYIQGKRVILVDDSIVRGTTSKKIVEMVRAAGARQVHMRISSPPTRHSCFYGIDTPEKEKLLAHIHSVDDMAKLIGVDSLAFISLDGLYRATGEAMRNTNAPQFCDACFSGDYPIALTDMTTCQTSAALPLKRLA
ncbi:MAG: amidophosphoribosyltransferase [Alphaproteobacteria bacterium]|nr:amidophosphoribosyltransferase [Alphaproteobacteria bacterium]NDC56114.1 amidophosphoribosyltransferase [Alphaproteobacteria bacterium]NDG04438.1 amidophosphoribosyltransferase [Alphaproteobacteria bacterium]